MVMHGLTFATKLEAGRTGRLKTIATITAAALLVAGCGGPSPSTSPKPQAVGDNPKKQGPPELVHLKWKGTGWKVKLGNGNEEDPDKAKTTLREGPTMFVVDIQGKNATFRNQDPLAVWEGSKSAPKSGINSTQIIGPSFNKQGNLVFWDLNQGPPVTLYYSIHFNEPDVPPVDPIIDNGGCC
jgi:hypothetical protein